MDPGSLDLAESRRILETEDAEEEAALTQEEEAEKDNIVKLASYNFSRSPSEQPQRSPNKKKLSRGMSFQPSVMEEDDDAAFGIRVYGDDGEEESEDDEEDDEYEPTKKASQMYGSSKFSEDDGDEERDSDNEDEDDVLQVEGVYDPREFEHLNVDAEVLSIFSHIQKYKPQTIILDYKLKPFIPDYIPAVGDIDAFIKVESENPLQLGLTVLDEPTAKQSDPNIMELQLRSLSKRSSGRMSKVKKVVNIGGAEDNKVVEKWIKDIDDLHRSKPPPTVQYSKQMPDIDLLMAEWPQELDTLLGTAGLPTAALDISLESYVDIICAILDIPIYKSRIQVSCSSHQQPGNFIFHFQALHVLFSLFSAFKQSQHFGHYNNNNNNQDHIIN